MAVLDIDLPGLDGLSAAEQLYEQVPDCRTLILTGLSQPGNLLRALNAFNDLLQAWRDKGDLAGLELV